MFPTKLCLECLVFRCWGYLEGYRVFRRCCWPWRSKSAGLNLWRLLLLPVPACFLDFLGGMEFSIQSTSLCHELLQAFPSTMADLDGPFPARYPVTNTTKLKYKAHSPRKWVEMQTHGERIHHFILNFICSHFCLMMFMLFCHLYFVSINVSFSKNKKLPFIQFLEQMCKYLFHANYCVKVPYIY